MQQALGWQPRAPVSEEPKLDWVVMWRASSQRRPPNGVACPLQWLSVLLADASPTDRRRLVDNVFKTKADLQAAVESLLSRPPDQGQGLPTGVGVDLLLLSGPHSIPGRNGHMRPQHKRMLHAWSHKTQLIKPSKIQFYK